MPEVIKTCIGCGAPLHPNDGGIKRGPNRKYCDVCRIRRQSEINRLSKQRRRDREAGKTQRNNQDKQLRTLNDIAVAARAEGLSYGKYIAKHGM